MLLIIHNISVSLSNQLIIKNLNLRIKSGEIHVIMGPNGIGKSTLANAISGLYNIYNGKILYHHHIINNFSIELLSRIGIFMSFQNPVDIPGVTWNSFLYTIINKFPQFYSKYYFSVYDYIISKISLLKINPSYLKRDVNVNFSGGEKKKFELLQMLILKPKLIILDEIDSGIDIDTIKLISFIINFYCLKTKCSFLIITHYSRILQYIHVDYVHIFLNNNIICSGDIRLSKFIEKYGYKNFVI